MAYDFLYDVSEGIATLTFNRPQVMNALTFEVYAQLRDVFETLRYDEAVRAIVLTGKDHRRFYEAFTANEKPQFTGR